MISPALKCLLAFSLAAVLTQIGAVFSCCATEVAKIDHKAAPVEQIPAEGQYPHALLSLTSETGSFSQFAFLVDKATRTLTVWRNESNKVKLVGAWPADIGRQDGDKVMEGDHKTPEGIYFFQT